MRILLIIISTAALFFTSCRSTRKIQTAITKTDTITIAQPVKSGEDSAAVIRENYTRLQSQKISFTTFNAKVDVDYVGGDGKKENVNVTLRMYKDSVIWLAVTGLFGIEGLRAYITQDSIRILNKLDKIYTGRSVAYIQEVTGLPLDLASMQELIIGNPIFLDSNIISYTRTSETISLLSAGDFFTNLITLNGGKMHHSKLDDTDINRHRTCDLSYDEYENKKGPDFSAKRRITVAEKSKLDIKLDFKSYSFNETLSFPFSVPKNYKSN
ncbi:MAG: DUF4292 domain-containing protein [Chitinophagaceae bacterium]|nr:DUF4292 domain-containing protein [Chitinophagaceae bacterium]